MKLITCTENLGASGAQYLKYTIAVIILAVLLPASCITTKKTSAEKTVFGQTDSITSEIRISKNISIPQAKATMKIPVQNILDLNRITNFTTNDQLDDSMLPKFQKKDGRASVELKRIDDYIHITATCDSLQALCEYYQRQLTHLKTDSLKEASTVKSASDTAGDKIRFILIGFVAGLIVFKLRG